MTRVVGSGPRGHHREPYYTGTVARYLVTVTGRTSRHIATGHAVKSPAVNEISHAGAGRAGDDFTRGLGHQFTTTTAADVMIRMPCALWRWGSLRRRWTAGLCFLTITTFWIIWNVIYASTFHSARDRSTRKSAT